MQKNWYLDDDEGLIVVTPDHLNYILKSYGNYMIDANKYLGIACVVQWNINDGKISYFLLSEEIGSILQFLIKNSSINDVNVLAKMFVDGQLSTWKKINPSRKLHISQSKTKLLVYKFNIY